MVKVIEVKKVKNPEISVIIPTLNEEKYLENTLLALKYQNFKLPFEIIVSDGKSKDRTIQIAKKYANKIVVCDKKGVAIGRNEGAKVASGKYLLFIDADTILLPNALNEIYKEIRKKDVVLVSVPILPNTFDLTLIFYYLIWNVFSKNSIKIKKPQIAGMFMCCKKSDFEKVGMFNPSYKILEDYDFSERIGKLGKIKIIDSTVALTSPRRFLKWGKIKGATKYLSIYLGYLMGIEKIAKSIKLYKPVR